MAQGNGLSLSLAAECWKYAGQVAGYEINFNRYSDRYQPRASST